MIYDQKTLVKNIFPANLLRENVTWGLMPLWAYVIAFLVPSVIIAIAWGQPWVPIHSLFEDPLTVAQRSDVCCKVYYGALSNLGVLVWSGTSAICLFTALFVFNSRRSKEQYYFFYAAGLLTGFLTLDELYLVHSNLLPSIGVPKIFTYGLYALLTAALLVRFIELIISHDLIAYLLAGMFLATSIFIDNLYWGEASASILIEDGAKFLGISFWSAFHISAAARMCQESSVDFMPHPHPHPHPHNLN